MPYLKFENIDLFSLFDLSSFLWLHKLWELRLTQKCKKSKRFIFGMKISYVKYSLLDASKGWRESLLFPWFADCSILSLCLRPEFWSDSFPITSVAAKSKYTDQGIPVPADSCSAWEYWYSKLSSLETCYSICFPEKEWIFCLSSPNTIKLAFLTQARAIPMLILILGSHLFLFELNRFFQRVLRMTNNSYSR